MGTDLEGAIVSWSSGAEHLYGYRAEEVAGQPVAILTGEGSAREMLDAVREGKRLGRSESVHRRGGDGEVPVSVAVAPVQDAAGEPVGAALVASDIGEPLRTRERLRGLEAEYRSLAELVPVVTYVYPVGERTTALFISRRVEAVLGYSAEEWLAEPALFPRLLHPDDRERVLAELAATSEAARPFRSEYRMLSRYGGIVWLCDEAVVVRDARGLPLCMQGYLLDVSDRKRAEEERERLLAAERSAVAESAARQQKLDFLARSSELLASSLDYELTLRRAAELAVRERADWCLVDVLDENGALARLAAAQAEPWPAEAAFEGRPGSEPEPEVLEVVRTGRAQAEKARLCVPLLARGRALGALTLLTVAPGRTYGADDVALAQELARSAALAIDNSRLYRELQERADVARVLTHVGDGVFLLDRGGVIRLWNPAAEAITGLAASAVLGRSAAEVIPGWERVANRVPVAAAPDQARAETVRIETGRGERWVLISGVEFFEGRVYAFRDVTEERRLEQRRAEFLAAAAHELRTPLAALYGAAETLRRHDLALDEAGRERFVSLIVDESERLGRTVNDILLANQLDVGRLDVGSEPFDPAELVERVVEAARIHAPFGVSFEVCIPEAVPPLSADRDKVRQVLVTLVDNAIKYSPDGGLIQVGVEPEGSTVRFHVRDEGLGIPAEEQTRIFEKFYRLDPDMTRGVGGTGLGLYIASELVARMGGRIWVESTEGEGSTFFLELPLPETSSPR